MKRRISAISLLLVFCLLFAAFPAAALADVYFPKFNEESLERQEPTAKEDKAFSSTVTLVDKIKDGAKYSSSTIKKIDTNIKAIKTVWLQNAAKHQKALALKKYGEYDKAIKVWQELIAAYRKEKNWEQLAGAYNWLGHTYVAAEDYPKAAEAYGNVLALEKESGLKLDKTMKDTVTKARKTAAEHPQEIPPRTIAVNAKEQLTIAVNGKTVSATYSSSNSKVAKVDKKGYVTGVKAGEAVITANAKDRVFTCVITVTDSSTVDSSDFAEEVLRLVNIEREKAGVKPLVLGSDALQKAAAIRAKECEESFSHTRPNGSKSKTVYAEVGIGISNRYLGENIFRRWFGDTLPADVVNSWMSSSGHKSNILHPKFRKMGVGFYRNDRGVTYCTQEFIS
ncbi:CAP domain-containing protein [Christensenellaceae bacterium OttesenSCG-928-L17]|nr:CAP domain-containing protein [Christensenellaceae bacterium OttesenSCG-928-L17]